jgi:DNA-binding transcriptional LysR family regulator
MNIHQLAVFHAVAEQGSLTRAAALLFISQPAVSKQLRELERSLGMALFHRLSTGVRLTEAGELLLGYSRQIFALEHEAESALRELHNLERGRLRIGASTTIGTYILPPACARFGRQYPKVELALDIDNSRAIVERLRAGRVDLAWLKARLKPMSSCATRLVAMRLCRLPRRSPAVLLEVDPLRAISRAADFAARGRLGKPRGSRSGLLPSAA